MEQRRLRLGDILDDYCPRERRVTNHAVVAMIEEDVKQTRCTTCDAEHPYKGARVPRRRKKEAPDALYKEVLAGMPDIDVVEAPALAAAAPEATARPSDDAHAAEPLRPAALLREPRVAAPTDNPEAVVPDEQHELPMQQNDNTGGQIVHHEASISVHDPAPVAPADEAVEPPDRPDEAPAVDGPVHRPLIRATLPRPEGQKDARPLPEFTVRQTPGRGGHAGHGSHGNGNFRADRMRMRSGSGNGNNAPNGNRAHGGPRFQGNSSGRPAGPGRQSSGRGGPSGFRSGNNGPNGKRGRGSRG